MGVAEQLLRIDQQVFMHKFTRQRLAWLTLALLFIAAAHTLRLSELNFSSDESWAIWQSFGTPAQILAWLPYDWTPLYKFMIGGWRLLVGIDPLMLRSLSMLLSLLGAAFTYAAGRRVGGAAAGALAMLIYAALPYSIFLSGYVRPYTLAHALVPLGFWLTVEYMRFFTPPPVPLSEFAGGSAKRRRGFESRDFMWGIALTLTLAASFWTTLVAPIWIAFFGVYTLIVYPLRRMIVRWTPVAIAFIVLSIPIMIARGDVASGRSVLPNSPPFFDGMAALLVDFLGGAWFIWAVLLVIGVIAVVVRQWRQQRRPTGSPLRVIIGLGVWCFGGMIAMYVFDSRLGFFRPSYLFWALTGLALFGGVLLAHLPRGGRFGAAALIAVLLFVPVPARVEQNFTTGGTQVFTWLRGHVRTGDVVVLDPSFDCLAPYDLDYHVRAFFPLGLQVSSQVSDALRVWYGVNQNTQDQSFFNAQTRDRHASIFVGSPTCLFRLYEAPPDVEGVLFANGMRFHGAQAVEALPDQLVPLTHPLAAREGETIRVRLWWSVDAAPAADYSVGLYLFDPDDGRLMAQDDSAPRVAPDPAETSRWQPDRYYIEDRLFTLPYPFVTDEYTLKLSVYQWWDNIRIAAPEADPDNLLDLLSVFVKSW